MPDPDDVLRAQLRALFLEELEDNLHALTKGLLALESAQGTSVPEDVLQTLFRAAHSLKGAAHAAAVPSAVGVCGRMEDLLASVRARERGVDDELLRALFDDLDELGAVAAGLRATPGDEGADAVNAPRPAHDRVRVDIDRLGSLVGQSAELDNASLRLAAVAAEVARARDVAATVRPGDVAAARRGSDSLVQVLDRLAADAAMVDRDVRRTARRLSATALELRLQPFVDICAGLDRTVRDLAGPTGKRLRLVIEGGDVELDRDVATALREPIVHLVRNAVDHGIEVPASRRAAGKADEATLRLTAVAEGSQVEIVVADDGAGLDTSALRAAAARHGITFDRPEDAAFTTGVSTAEQLTDVSGRGVGLDAVRARVESLGGSVQLRSRRGAGTEAILHVPVTLSTMRVVLVRAGEELVALPAVNIDRLELIDPTVLRRVEQRTVLPGPAGPVPVFDLRLLLGFDDAAGPGSRGRASIVRVEGDIGALWVDGFESELETTLRQLPARAAGSTGVMGAITLPTGRVALVVNPVTCLRHGLSGAHAAAPPLTSVDDREASRVLLVEDSVTTRALERNILAAAGYEVVVAVDGAEAWGLLQEHAVDVVVSDVDMPGVDGIELTRRMRGSAAHRDVPIVLVTSLADESDRRRGLEAGANAYIVKSAFDRDALLAAIARLL